MYQQVSMSRNRLSRQLSKTNAYVDFLEKRIQERDEQLAQVGVCGTANKTTTDTGNRDKESKGTTPETIPVQSRGVSAWRLAA